MQTAFHGTANLPQTAGSSNPSLVTRNHEGTSDAPEGSVVNISDSPDYVNHQSGYSTENRKLYALIYETAQGEPEWNVALTGDQQAMWTEWLYSTFVGVSDVPDEQVHGICQYIARKYGPLAHHYEVQRNGAYVRAATVRERNQPRDASIVECLESGMSVSATAARHEVSRPTVDTVWKRHCQNLESQSPAGLLNPDPEELSLQGGIGEYQVPITSPGKTSCSGCASKVPEAAVRCPYCGHSLETYRQHRAKVIACLQAKYKIAQYSLTQSADADTETAAKETA